MTLPNRQDSKAYSTFTFNRQSIASTQSALLMAHRAFQETQTPQKTAARVNDENEPPTERNSPGVPRVGAITPFRAINPQDSQVPDAGREFEDVKASTQDLNADAAGLMFSTVKKPHASKRANFGDWPIRKPSQLEEAMASPALFKPPPRRSILKQSQAGNTQSQVGDSQSRSAMGRSLSQGFPSSALPRGRTWIPRNESNSLATISDTTLTPFQSAKPISATFSSFHSPTFSASAPSPMPVASYEAGQHAYEVFLSTDSFRFGRPASTAPANTDTQRNFDSQDIIDGLDMANSVLSTANIEHEIAELQRASFSRTGVESY
jgi:hypothetical protein